MQMLRMEERMCRDEEVVVAEAHICFWLAWR
jgi:hypothetical protein